MTKMLASRFAQFCFLSASPLALVVAATPAAAQAQTRAFDIPAQPLSSAVLEFSRQADVMVVLPPELAAGKRSAAVKGSLSVNAAIAQLLRRTGLRAMPNAAGGYRVAPFAAGRGAARAESSTASSGGATDSDRGDSAEIVVTASKREQRATDVPISITALSGAEIDRRATHDILSVSRSVPGFVVVDRGPGEQQYTLRGVGNQNGSSSLVGVYLDEMAITSDPLRQIDLPLIDLERVEVLRGPQGTLYGAGSVGGTVRFITRDPEFNGVSGHVDATAFLTEKGDPSAEATAVLNVPIATDKFAVRLAGHYMRQGGWIDQPAAGTRDINEQKLFDFRAKALLQATDDLQLRANIAVHRLDAGWANIANPDYNLIYAVDRTQSPPPRSDDYELYNFTANYDFGGAQLVSSTGYLDSRKSLPFSQISNPGIEFAGINKVDSKVFTQELRLNSEGSGPLNWTVGAFYQDSRIKNPLSFDLLIVGGPLLPGLTNLAIARSESIAGFGQVSYLFANRLEIGVGGRYFRDKADDGSNAQQRTFHAFSPNGFARYKLSDNANIYASVGRGFRSGGFNSVGSPFYSPEHVIAYEIGIKSYSPARKLNIEAALFRMDYRDMLAFSSLSVSNPINVLFNLGRARIQGFDASVTWQPTSALRLGLSGNYTDHKITKIDRPPSSNIVGDPVNYVSDYNASAWAELRFQWSEGVEGTFRADYSRVGKMHFINRLLGVSEASNDLGFLDLRLGARSGAWSAELFGTNVTNENGAQIPFSPVETSRPRPRSVGLRLGYNFN